MNDLTFRETPTGWDVQVCILAFNREGERFHTIGRLEQENIDEGCWCYLPSDGGSLSLPELDQIRHKLANLEQVRLLKAEKC